MGLTLAYLAAFVITWRERLRVSGVKKPPDKPAVFLFG
jgi:hypothetical protein